MKPLFTILLVISFLPFGNAQTGTFTISINKKVLLTSKIIPTTTAEKATISKSLVKINNAIAITIRENEPQKDWHRVFMLYNDKEEEIGRFIQKTTSGIFTISTKDLKRTSGSVLKIITMTEPNDPNAAATMRLRTFPLVDITVK